MTVTPPVGLWDQPRTIVILHLSPGQVVTVNARTPRQAGIWTASATFKANDRGVVDLARDAPITGSYEGISPMGLFWSQHEVGTASATSHSRVTTLTVSAGTRQIASATVTQLLRGPGVAERAETVSKVGFSGVYFASSGSARRPAVVAWGGSEGGLVDTIPWAALLASHGIPTLALAYFDGPGLPCALNDIPLEYFVKAIAWMRRQPQVDPARVWLFSGSRGTEAELLVAAHWPGLAHGVVAEAPSSVVYDAYPGQCQPKGSAAWTLHGRPVPHDEVVLTSAATYNRDGSVNEVSAFADGLGLPSANDARIPVNRIEGPVLLISGGDDQLWPSDTYAAQIMSGLGSDRAIHQHLNYPDAGHIVLDVPYTPPVIETPGPRGRINLGGSAAADEAAHLSDWPATINFITHH
ncbi:MAG: acyl-CoA thioesterase/BAAT N-terminal domain-containing protein [Solirubrobacterales bacterium]|nr:acyl-CoA thioesterase/BAAT N-terminal domain-containing protein [Solirubrobacterales bacterium]